jgi:hypothetical protein
MTRCDFVRPCIFTTQKTLRENAQSYRFWGLLDSCLADIAKLKLKPDALVNDAFREIW